MKDSGSSRQWVPLRIYQLAAMSLIGLAMLLAGCTMVGPDFVKPAAQEAESWIESEDPRLTREPSDYRDWWTLFNDPVLTALVERAYEQNLPLEIAGLRILEARAQLGVLTGSLYPQLQQGRGGAQYSEVSDNTANTSRGGDTVYWEYDAGFDVSWELDVWGKFRRAVESGVANLEASVADYDDVLVSLSSEVARTYVVLRTLEERLMVALDNVKIQQRSLEIAEVRFEAGAVTELDVQQARSLLKDTEASIPRFEAGIRQAKNALATLLGTLPGGVDGIIGEPSAIPGVPEKVVVDIPAELLRRRPDIQFAEYQIATQGPLIGVAKADLYPAFSLFGSIGLRSSNSGVTRAGGSSFSDLWDSDSVEIFAGPSFTWNLLNYGRIKNQVRVEDARLQQLIVNYEDTVLRAQQEVEDSLVGFLRKQEEEVFLLDSVKASQRSVDLSMIQYREGLVDYQRVLDTQRFLTTQQDTWTAARGDVVLNLIAMYKALGGGWQIREGKDFVPSQTMEEMQERTNWGKVMTTEKLTPPLSETPEERKKWRWPDW